MRRLEKHVLKHEALEQTIEGEGATGVLIQPNFGKISRPSILLAGEEAERLQREYGTKWAINRETLASSTRRQQSRP